MKHRQAYSAVETIVGGGHARGSLVKALMGIGPEPVSTRGRFESEEVSKLSNLPKARRLFGTRPSPDVIAAALR